MVSEERLHFAEGLGDNCEFGFVLQKHDHHEGGVFRWMYSPFEATINTISSDFQGIFQFDNLVSLNGGMITDTQSGLSFHSKMVSIRENRKMRFVDDVETRRPFYDTELEKLNYLIGKFRRRLLKPNITYFLRNRYALTDDQLCWAHDVLAHRRGSCPFKLVDVEATDQVERHGTIKDKGNGLFVGHVGWMAPVSNADNADYENWSRILDQTLPHPSALSVLAKRGKATLRTMKKWTGLRAYAGRRSGQADPDGRNPA